METATSRDFLFSVPMIFEYYMHNVQDVQDVSPNNRTAAAAQNLDQHFPGKSARREQRA
jgi:hypothetical protein